MSVLRRNNVVVGGSGSRTIMFAHGFGCDQNMWRFVEPAFEDRFTHDPVRPCRRGQLGSIGLRRSQIRRSPGYADDVVDIGRELGLRRAIFVGHSVSAMIGALATIEDPSMFEALVMVSPSPRYIDDGDYVGGFAAGADRRASRIPGGQSHGLVGSHGARHHGQCRPTGAWARAREQLLPDRSGDRQGLRTRSPSSATTAPISPAFRFGHWCCNAREDAIAPRAVGEYVHAQIPNSELVVLKATGHCPNLSAPDEVIAAIEAFV